VGWLGRGINSPLAAGALALAVYGLLFADDYQLRVLTLSGIYAILVMGYHFIFGQAGALSLAQGAFFGIGAYLTGVLGAVYGWSFAATFPLSVLAPVLLAAVVSAPVLRLASHYFALATLGIGQVVLLVAINWQSVTGGANGIPSVPGIAVLGIEIGRGVPLLAVVWGLVALGAMLAWQTSRGLYGRMFHVMRENDVAARSMGIDVARLRLVAFLLSAAYAGVAGALYAHSIGVVSPEALEFPVMVACLTMAVVGGRFRVAGAVLGAVILVHLPEWFRFLEKYYLMAYGGGMLLMITVAPYGLVGALERLRQRLAPASAPPPPPPRAVPLPAGSEAPLLRTGPLLEVADACKRFGGVQAVDGLSLDMRRGEILGLIGPNGSGKTTLVNLITGIHALDAGRVTLRRQDITTWPPARIARHGIARSFQIINLVDEMTALDNVAVARATAAGEGFTRALASLGPRSSLAEARRHAMSLLESLDVEAHAMRPCRGLPHGAKRRVEIARALATQPELLLLDEPAAGLDEIEQADLADRLRGLAATGLTLMIIEHNMPFLMPLAERIVCLEDGRVIAEGAPEAVRADPRVVEAYLGPPGPEATVR